MDLFALIKSARAPQLPAANQKLQVASWFRTRRQELSQERQRAPGFTAGSRARQVHVERGTSIANEGCMFSRQARSESNVTRSLQRETRGAVFVEYVVLVAFAGLVLALILSTMGPRVVASYSARRALLYSHAP